MYQSNSLSRRSFLAVAGASTLAAAVADAKSIPVGLELYSVRDELKQDLTGTLRAVAGMGYQCVEFFAPYYDWTPAFAKDIRKQLDDLGVRCYSTHNGPKSFTPEGLPRAQELNYILGARFIVFASAGNIRTIDGWTKVAGTLNEASTQLRPAGLRTGYHNHQLEFTPIGGVRPIEVLAANTNKDVMLQLDVGTCVEAGSDPVAWINQNPGRINSLHCKDWSPKAGYKVVFGEGAVDWLPIIQAATKTGGLEFLLIEQEGSAYPELETAKRCLANYHKLISKL